MVGHSVNIFLSSPGDVRAERDAAERVVTSLNAENPNGIALNLIRWEKNFYTAASGFQDQISPTDDCDLVICIFWKSLGSELPEHYRRPDGVLPTGTEFEFETALNRSLKGPDQVPDVLVYRKTADVFYRAETADLEKQQFARFQAFWARWFRNEQGHYVAGFHAFADLADFEAQLRQHLKQWLSQRGGAVTWQKGSPFRGLEPFDLEHAPIFFGRSRDVARLRARFLANALRWVGTMVVAGPSGSGKSSLLRAGFLPNILKTTSAPDLPRFAVHRIFRPSDLLPNWPEGLAGILFSDDTLGEALASGDANTPERLGAVLGGAAQTARLILEGALERMAGDEKTPQALVLVVDQLEEIFVWPEAARDGFADLLEALTQSGRVFVVASMRSEFLSRLGDIPALARMCEVDAVSGGSAPVISVNAPELADLRQVIVGPAEAAGLHYEGARDGLPSLDARIEADISRTALPALQYLLQKLYEARDGTMLTHASYDALGGVSQVMARAGDAALDGLTEQDREAFPALARRLLIIRDAQTAAVSRSVRTDTLSPMETRVADALATAGLLVRDAGTARLAHEALIADWGRLADLIGRDKRLLEARYRLGLLARNHAQIATDAPKQAKSALLRGFALSEGQELQARWSTEEIAAEEPSLPGFIAASVAAARAAHWKARGAIFAVVAIVLGAGLAVLLQVQRAGELEILAELQASTAKAAQASLRTGDWPVAVAEARRARSLLKDAETLSLAMSVALGAESEDLVEIRDGDHVDLGFTKGGTLYALTGDGALTTGESTTQFPPPTGPQERYVEAISRDDGTQVALTNLGKGYLRRDAGEIEAFTWREPGFPPQHLILQDAPTGFVIVTVDIGTATVQGRAASGVLLQKCSVGAAQMSCDDNRITTDDTPGTFVRSVALSEDSQHLAYSTSRDGVQHTIWLPQARSGARAKELGVLQHVSHLAFGDQDRRLFVRAGAGANAGGSLPQIFAFDLENGTGPTPFVAVDESMAGFGADPGAARIVHRCWGETLCLEAADQTVRKLYRAPATPYRVKISGDGTQVAAILQGQLRHWSLTAPRHAVSVLPIAGSAGISSLWTAEDGSLFGLGRDLTLHVWSANGEYTEVRQGETRPTGSNLRSMAGLADGTLVFAFGDSAIGIFDTALSSVRFEPMPFAINRVAVGPDGKWLAAGLAGVVSDVTTIPTPDGVRVGGVTSHGNQIYFSTTDGGLWQHGGGRTELAVPIAQTADDQAGLSLDVHPGGRFLTVTRSDRQVLIHDLSGVLPPARLELPTADSRTVRFSPSGAYITVLTSAGALGVWTFDAETNTAGPHILVDPVPPALIRQANGPAIRQANWISWLNEDRIAVASETGDVIVLSIDPAVIDARLESLQLLYANQ